MGTLLYLPRYCDGPFTAARSLLAGNIYCYGSSNVTGCHRRSTAIGTPPSGALDRDDVYAVKSVLQSRTLYCHGLSTITRSLLSRAPTCPRYSTIADPLLSREYAPVPGTLILWRALGCLGYSL